MAKMENVQEVYPDSAPCTVAAADIDHSAKEGLLQAFGVFINMIVICSYSALIMLLSPADLNHTNGLEGMDLLQTSMLYHMGRIGVVFATPSCPTNISAVIWIGWLLSNDFGMFMIFYPSCFRKL